MYIYSVECVLLCRLLFLQVQPSDRASVEELYHDAWVTQSGDCPMPPDAASVSLECGECCEEELQVSKSETKIRMVWGSFLIAALKTPTRNGYRNERPGVNPI